MIQYRNDTTSTSQSLCPHKLKFSCSTFQAIEQERKKRELFSDIIDIAKPKKTTKAGTSPPKVQKVKEEPFEVPAKTEKESPVVDEEAQMEAMKKELKKGKKEKKMKREKEEEEESPPPAKKAKKKKKAKSYLDDL